MNAESITVLLASTAALFGLSLLIVVFVIYYQKRLLQQKVKVQELEQRRQQDQLRALVQGQERERARLAKEMHDEVGALLTATKLQVNQLERTLDDPKKRGTFLGLTKEMLEESIGSVRAVSHGLLPATLAKFGLKTALTHLGEAFTKSQVLSVVLTVDVMGLRFDEATELGVYRVVQEMLNNTAKHSQAQQAALQLHYDGKAISFVYQDDGVGMNLEASSEGLGLKNLETRMMVLGGTLQVQSAPGQGFKAEGTLPATSLKNEA